MDRRDFDTDIWRRLRALLEARLVDHRLKNDRPQNTELQTAIIRGRIQEIKDLLALDRAPANNPSPDEALDS